jgi:hypothetical protein
LSASGAHGLARWLLAALACPVIGFWVCNQLPLDGAGQSTAGLGYIVIGIENLAIFVLIFCIGCPLVLRTMARSLPVSFVCAAVVGAACLAHFYWQMNVDPARGLSPIAAVDLRNEAVALAVTAVLFIFVGLRSNPIFENLHGSARRYFTRR